MYLTDYLRTALICSRLCPFCLGRSSTFSTLGCNIDKKLLIWSWLLRWLREFSLVGSWDRCLWFLLHILRYIANITSDIVVSRTRLTSNDYYIRRINPPTSLTLWRYLNIVGSWANGIVSVSNLGWSVWFSHTTLILQSYSCYLGWVVCSGPWEIIHGVEFSIILVNKDHIRSGSP